MKAPLKGALAEVTRALEAEERQIPEGVAEAYVGGGRSKLTYLGLKVPQVRGVARRGFTFLSADDPEILRTWDYIWRQSPIYEVMLVAVDYYGDKRRRGQLLDAWPVLRTWAGKIDNWAHSDCLSSIYAATLEDDRKLVLPTLEEWSESKNPWLRRQSIVSLIYYAGSRKKVLPYGTLESLVKKQIGHDDHYVQKGVGWTLRETFQVYPDKTWAFLQKHALSLSSSAFQAATEKLDQKRKSQLKELRRAARHKR